MIRMTESFLKDNKENLVNALIGYYFVNHVDGQKIMGKISKARLVTKDEFIDIFKKDISKDIEKLSGLGDIIYVVNDYDKNMFTLVCQKGNEKAVILIEEIDPIFNVQKVSLLTYDKPYNELNEEQKSSLLKETGQVCKGFGIFSEDTGKSILSEEIYISRSK